MRAQRQSLGVRTFTEIADVELRRFNGWTVKKRTGDGSQTRPGILGEPGGKTLGLIKGRHRALFVFSPMPGKSSRTHVFFFSASAWSPAVARALCGDSRNRDSPPATSAARLTVAKKPLCDSTAFCLRSVAQECSESSKIEIRLVFRAEEESDHSDIPRNGSRRSNDRLFSGACNEAFRRMDIARRSDMSHRGRSRGNAS